MLSTSAQHRTAPAVVGQKVVQADTQCAELPRLPKRSIAAVLRSSSSMATALTHADGGRLILFPTTRRRTR